MTTAGTVVIAFRGLESCLFQDAVRGFGLRPALFRRDRWGRLFIAVLGREKSRDRLTRRKSFVAAEDRFELHAAHTSERPAIHRASRRRTRHEVATLIKFNHFLNIYVDHIVSFTRQTIRFATIRDRKQYVKKTREVNSRQSVFNILHAYCCAMSKSAKT